MGKRIAHRPRYRTSQKPALSTFYSRQSFLRAYWKYRNTSIAYEKHALGYQLSLTPLRHRLMQQLVLYQAF
jgi:hypothetical protein